MKKFIILILILSSFFFIKNVNAGSTDVFSYNWYGEQRFTSLDNPSSYIQRCYLINSNINDNSFVYAYYNNYVYVLFYNSDLEYFDYMFNVKKIEDNSFVGKIYCRFQISSDVISLNAKSDVFNWISDFQNCYNNGNCYISNDVVLNRLEFKSNLLWKDVFDFPKCESGVSGMSIEELSPYLIALGMCVLLVFLAIMFKKR